MCITQLSLRGNNLRFTFPGKAGLGYTLQARSDFENVWRHIFQRGAAPPQSHTAEATIKLPSPFSSRLVRISISRFFGGRALPGELSLLPEWRRWFSSIGLRASPTATTVRFVLAAMPQKDNSSSRPGRGEVEGAGASKLIDAINETKNV